MGEILAKVAQWGKTGMRNVAAGKAGAQFGLNQPDTAATMVRLGRAAYVSSIAYIALAWYTGFCNERTHNGEMKFILPGGKLPVINSPDRPNKAPFGVGKTARSTPEALLENAPETFTNPFGMAVKVAKALGVSESTEPGTTGRTLTQVSPSKMQEIRA